MRGINNWAEKMTKDIYDFYKNKFPNWKYGIKIFYSPVNERPPLTIIAYQPGGKEDDFKKDSKDFFENNDFHLPEKNEYIDKQYRLAEKMQELFDFKRGLSQLRESVVFNLIFFRAQNVKIWKKESGKNRKEMEKFCFEKVKEIIEQIQPKKILVLGISTYDEFKKIYPVSNEEILFERGSRKERMFIRAKSLNFEVFGMIHPAGARISTEDRNKLKELIKEDLS